MKMPRRPPDVGSKEFEAYSSKEKFELIRREGGKRREIIEEAITSSQMEGAATTRKVAKEMLRSGRPARD